MRGAPSSILALTILLPLALAPGLRADEEPSPAERQPALASAFPVPSAAHAFTFRGDAKLDGLAAGTLILQAKPVSMESGSVLWAVTERLELLGGRLVRGALAVLDRTLDPMRGVAEEGRMNAPPYAVTWQRVERAFEVRPKTPGGAEATEVRRVAAPVGGSTTTLTALALLSRHVLPETGTSEITLFHPAARDGAAPLQSLLWEVKKDAVWAGRPAWSGAGRKGEGETLELFFEPETERLLGVRLMTPGGSVLEAHAAPEKAGGEMDPFVSPALSAEAAALQAALAFAAADLPLLTAVTHWPSVRAVAAARYEAANPEMARAEPFPDAERYEARQMHHFAQTLLKRPRQLVEATLREIRDQLQEERQENGLVQFTFPAAFDGLQLVVGEFDGFWYLARFPSVPR